MANGHIDIALICPNQALEYMKMISKHSDLFDFIRHSYKMERKKAEGLESHEVDQLIKEAKSSSLKALYENMYTTVDADDESTLLAITNTISNQLKEIFIIYNEKDNDKYNILSIHATQIKEIDKQKLTTLCEWGTIVDASLFGAPIPWTGFVPDVVAAGVGGYSFCVDYSDEHMSKLVYGYIFRELKEKRILSVINGKYTLSKD